MTVVLLAVVPSVTISQQSDSTSASTDFGIRFRSVQAQAATLLLVNSVGVSFDVDMVQFNPTFAAGVRGGIQHTSKTALVSQVVGSPYTDFDFLLRFSSSRGDWREDLLLGYVYHTGTERPYVPYQSSGKFKFGGELKYMLWVPTVGLLLAANSTIEGATKPVTVVAVGIVVGWGL